MRTQVTIIYKFHELSESAQEHAVSQLRYINVDHDWWDHVYEDAEDIGLKITGFDLGRNCSITGDFTEEALTVVHNIVTEHGEGCGTVETVRAYMTNRRKEIAQLCQDEADEFCVAFSYFNGVYDIHDTDEYELDLVLEDIDKEFLQSLLEDYRIMLQKDYEYLTSEEAIVEHVKISEYEFIEEGNLV